MYLLYTIKDTFKSLELAWGLMAKLQTASQLTNKLNYKFPYKKDLKLSNAKSVKAKKLKLWH